MIRCCFSILMVLFVFAGVGRANPDLYVSDERPNWIPLLLFIIISSGIAASVGVSMLCRRIRLPEVPEIHPMPDEEVDIDVTTSSGRHRHRGRQPASFYKSYPFDYDDSEFDDDDVDVDDVRGRVTSHGAPVTSHQAPLPVINVNTHRL